MNNENDRVKKVLFLVFCGIVLFLTVFLLCRKNAAEVKDIDGLDWNEKSSVLQRQDSEVLNRSETVYETGIEKGAP